MKTIFLQKEWYFKKFDGRRKIFRGISRTEFEEAKEKHIHRAVIACGPDSLDKSHARMRALSFFLNIPYEYKGDGLDDYNKYQRPASNGVGWVAICPGERCNNYYIDDPRLVAILKKRYEKNRK